MILGKIIFVRVSSVEYLYDLLNFAYKFPPSSGFNGPQVYPTTPGWVHKLYTRVLM